MAYRLIIFDFDGTLADTGAYMADAMNRAARRFGFREFDEAERETLRGQSTRAVLKQLRVPLWRMPAIARFMRAEAAQGAHTFKLFDGMPEALRRLHGEGCMLGVVSSNAEGNIRRVLGDELAGMIGVYACEASLFGKAGKFREALRRAKCKPGEALSIGDEERDIEAARRVGIACGAVAWGYATPEALTRARPDYMFASPAEISASPART